MVTLTVTRQPFASLTLNTCNPAERATCEGVIWYGGFPPAAVITALPSAFPLHFTFSWLVSVAVKGAEGSVILTLTVVVHPLLSVTKNKCVPAERVVWAGVIL